MIPFAFDLISTFVIGSILPVATTDLTIVPRSTVARRDSSTPAAAPFSEVNPQIPAIRSVTTTQARIESLRDRFISNIPLSM